MKRSDQRGFAMLLVFVMAASVAIMLYQELPRVAFEAQRDREELLIERGEQYSRAVQLYVRKFNKFPATMDDLEKVNQVRFLRQRYKDPMTDSEEWRIIHVGPGGVFLDSLVHKPPEKEGEQKSVNTFTHESASIGSSGADPGAPVASAVRQTRDSERRGMPGMLQSTNAPPADAEADPNNPGQQQPGAQPQNPTSQQQPGVQGNPQTQNLYGQQQPVVQTNQNPNPYGQPGFPAGQQQPGAQNPFGQQAPVSWQPGQQQQQPRQPQPGQQAMVGAVGGAQQQPAQQQPQTPAAASFVGGGSSFVGGSVSVQPQQPYQPPQPSYQPPGTSQPIPQPGGLSPFPSQQPRPPVPSQARQPGSQAGSAIGQTPNAAASMIQQILTTPRANPMQQGGQGGNQTIGGGIAGVASTLELEGIKIYNDRTAYHEWEFVYDVSKEAAKAAAAGGGQVGIPGAPGQQQPAQRMQGGPGGPGGGMPSPNFPPGMGAPVRPGR